MLSFVCFITFYFTLPWFSLALPVAGHDHGSDLVRHLKAFVLPIRRSAGAGGIHGRRGISGSIGLGDNSDLLYTVPIKLGNTTTAVNLDTGSSDLWVISDLCNSGSCNASSAARYSSASLNSTGASVTLNYGDSTTGTHAQGPIGLETATIAGVTMTGQSFAAINSTTNPTVEYGASGIFGLGFPTGSILQHALVAEQFPNAFTTDHYVASTYANGPLLSRIAMTGQLDAPMFTISLQRDTIDVSGQGMLTVGKLPDGVDNSSLTWVPVRLYTPQEGGISPPTFAPNEVYPYRWEIDIDGVFLDGQELPISNISAVGVQSDRPSALIDTGNSLLRGPSDVISNILKTVSPTYASSNDNKTAATLPCSTPHSIAFQIGGKRFPVDPRDFITPSKSGDSTTCVASSVVATDPPSTGSLFSWNLGDPFFKSNLIAFYYGNLTHPSVDPPRMGFLSMVPSDADNLLEQAVQSAQKNGGNFRSTSQLAPTASAAAAPQVTVVPLDASAEASQVTAVNVASPAPKPSNTRGTNGSLRNSEFSNRSVVWIVFALFGMFLLV